MKDLLGREIQVGNYIAYGMRSGNSGHLKIYQVKEVLDGKLKVLTAVNGIYSEQYVTTVSGESVQRKYAEFKRINHDDYGLVKLSEQEIEKVKNKTSTITQQDCMFILDGFSPELFKDKE